MNQLQPELLLDALENLNLQLQQYQKLLPDASYVDRLDREFQQMTWCLRDQIDAYHENA